MRIIYISACIFLMGSALHAQAPKKAAAKPAVTVKTNKANAPKITVKTMSVPSKSGVQYEVINGVRVILKPAANEVVSAVLFITGGVKNYDLSSQGVESLALNVALDGGTKKYPKEVYHDILEQKGISLDASSSYDYSDITLRTIDKNWNTAWDMLADVITHPAWDAQSFEQVKGQVISGLQQQQSDPDSKIREMSITSIFKGTPYESNPEGTPEAVNTLDLAKLKSLYSNIMMRKKFVLAVVGKVSMDDLRKKVEAAFASLPLGVSDPFVSNPPKVSTASVNIEEREIATNYIQGIFSAPPVGTRENVAMRIGTSILSDRLFIEIRTKRNLSYAPSAYVATMFNPYGSVYVSTTNPNDAVQVMMDEIRKVKKEGFTEKELRDKKEGFLTAFYMGQETNQAQALTYGLSELRGDWHKAETFKDEVHSLTTQELNDVFRKYATAISWFYLGDKSKVSDTIFKSKLE
jgi:zinc protease